MSATSSPESTPSETPFDPAAFPPDLLEAQRRAAELFAALHVFQATLPWSREPSEGWPADKERKRSGRDATDGWTAEQGERYDALREELREAAAAVNAHEWWRGCADEGVRGGALVDLRQVLKHADGAVPLRREDVAATA
ncbi:hypothetical protein ACIPSE_45905 [Streptomyces sp. NPDC090106]|uniref:hypothetical protein n=1 Tax=Streptomyces sp. NPDC090106 TaxID=3365946 RepID=UPI003800AD33